MSVGVSARYRVRFDQHDQTLVLAGSMRPRTKEDIEDLDQAWRQAVSAVSGMLYIDCKRLTDLNNAAFRKIYDLCRWTLEESPSLKIQIVCTSVIPWSRRKFELLSALGDRLEIAEYDSDFYPGQGAIENESFIPVLRTQTKIIWGQEREMLKAHGLREGMKVADICCGIGDFALLVAKEFKPTELVAVDHSKPSLEYARRVAADFGVSSVEYQYGDASSLLLEDDTYDFVTCRLSLQIFDRPDEILKELYRICKPGGRVYLTNESYSRCFGEPGGETVAWTYQEAARLFGELGMDLDFGTKMYRFMLEQGLQDISIDPMVLTKLNADPEAFADVIRSWQDYVVNELAREGGESEEYCRKLWAGFDEHIRAVSHPKGFGGWPIWVGSGVK